MPKDPKLKIQRAVSAGPDMRKPQYHGGYEPPSDGVAEARFIGYFELGKHDCIRNGLPVCRERVRMVFELSGKAHPGRLVDGVLVPYVVSVETDLDLSPGARFFDTFARMNFENAASHMVELLGDAFFVSVGHRPFRDRPGVYATVDAYEGYLICPAKSRHAASGTVVEVPMSPASYRVAVFVWATADRDDWYDLYIPGEWPEQRDAGTGEVIKPARSKNVLQEKITAARNWPDHPLASVVQIGPGTAQPSKEESERQRAEELREWQEENWRQLKASLDEVIAKFHKEHPTKRARSKKARSSGAK